MLWDSSERILSFASLFSKVVPGQTDQGDWVVTFIVADCTLTIINVQTIEAVIKQSIVTAAPSLKAKATPGMGGGDQQWPIKSFSSSEKSGDVQPIQLGYDISWSVQRLSDQDSGLS